MIQQQRSITSTHMATRLTRALIVARYVASVVHAQWVEDIGAEVVLKRLTADVLDDPTRPVDSSAVLPALARVASQRRIQYTRLGIRSLFELMQRTIPICVCMSRCVCEELSERNRRPRRSQPRITL